MIRPGVPRPQRWATEGLTEGFSVTLDAGIAAVLLEREGELVQIGEALSQARGGSGRGVLISGPAGIGKTRLLDESGEHARALGFEVLRARGGELESGYGFGVVRQLLESTLVRATGTERDELLSGAAALARAVFAASAPEPDRGAADPTQPVLHGLYWLVANLAERAPLLLAIDDVQWADEPSLRFLVYLARRLEGTPIVLLLAVRSGEESVEPELLRALQLQAHPPPLEPSALTLQATTSLAVARLGHDVSEALGRACHEATGGNPFLLTELLQQLRGEAADVDPAAIARMASERMVAATLLRIGRTGPSAAAFAHATAVLGESADVEAAAQLAGLDSEAAAQLVDALTRAQILQPDASSAALRFVHPLVRTAVYEDMRRPERARLHAAAAALLAGRRGGLDAAAMHLLRAEPTGDERVVEVLREAARAAIARGAPETAAQFLRRAEREPPSAELRAVLLLELGTAASRAGHDDGVALLREAFELAETQPARARAGIELAFWLGVSRTGSAEAIPVLMRSREGLLDEDLRAPLDTRLVMIAIHVPVLRELLGAHLRAARSAFERGPSEVAPALLSQLGAELAFTGATAAASTRLAEQALAGGHLMQQDVETESDFAGTAVFVLIATGELSSAKRHLDDGVAFAQAHGSPFAVARIAAIRALTFWRLGDLRGAEADADTALAVVAAWGIPHAVSTAALAAVRIERGDITGAREIMDALDTDPAMLAVSANQVVREVRGALLMAEGKPREALGELLACGLWEQQGGLDGGPIAWRPAAALAHLQLGEAVAARDLATREVEMARAFGAPPRLAVALRALGIVEGGEAGVAALAEAVALLEGSAARLDHARALVELGALLRRSGQRASAAERLRAGMDLAHRCAATALVATAAQELRLAGARPRRIALTGRDSLTPGERRVTDLAVQGMSNKQIAQALFVTLRTVEMHLSNAYGKLEISAREQLAAALGAG